MRFRNAIRLVFENFSSLYKMLLYKLVLVFIFIALFSTLVVPSVLAVLKSAEITQFFTLVKEFLTSIYKNEMSEDFAGKFNDSIQAILLMIKAKTGRLVLSLSFAVIIFIVVKFLNGLSTYAVGSMVNDHMSRLSHLGFMHYLARDFKNACKYEILYILITLLYDVASLLISYYVLFYLFKIFTIISIALSVTLYIGLLALKYTYTSSIMPSMIVDKTCFRKALKNSFNIPKKHVGRLFSNYLFAIYVIMSVNVLVAFSTLFSGLIISIPLSSLLLISIQFVNYYTVYDKKYFINYENIIIPKNLKEDEKLLDD